MKKSILILFMFLMSGVSSFSQTTATDFTVTDCGGTSHHLFAELDAGKIIVLAMVEPCGSCIGPSKSALDIVNSFATSNPGKVVYYLTSGYSFSTCASLSGWGTQNHITGVPVLTSTSITQSNYGGSAMPKIVVIARPDHHVFFNQNNGLNTTNLTAAINLAIATAGVNEQQQADFQISVYPNPASDKLSVNYNLNQTSDINFEIYNLLGTKVKSFTSLKQPVGNRNEIQLDVESLNNGIYFLKMTVGEFSQIIRFTVAR